MRIGLLLCALIVTMEVAAQNEKISEIKAPSSPAAVIIGNQPTAISRPKSWEAVEAAIFSNATNDEGGLIIPNDFGLEVTPYWLQKDLKIDMDDFMNPSAGLSLLQNFSISVATTKNFIIKDSIKTDAIGFGLRTMLWQGSKRYKEKTNELLNKIQDGNKLTGMISKLASDILEGDSELDKKDFVNELIATISLSTNRTALIPELNDDEQNKFIEKLNAALTEQLPDGDETALEDALSDIVQGVIAHDEKIFTLEEMIKDRYGFKLEVAGAASLNFPTNETDYSIVPKYSIWITPSYQPFENDNFEFLGVLRYNFYNADFYERYQSIDNFFDHNFDYGVRLVYKQGKFSVEGEAVGRYSKVLLERDTDPNGVTVEKSRTQSDFQYLLNFNYRLSESVILSYSFGKKFQPATYGENTLVSVATLNFGIGAPKENDIKK